MHALPRPIAKGLPLLLPLAAIALARFLTFTPWAQANSGWAAILFAWVVADALLLALMAKAEDHKPAFFQVIGVLSVASIVVLVGASAPVRAEYFALPQVLIAAGVTLALYLAMSAIRVITAYRETGSIIAGFERVLPKPLVRQVATECKMLSLGLLRWGAPVDVPAGARAFAYHTYLTPMVATFLVLQLIELSVVHFLLMLWNPTVAWVLLALSVWGVVWTMALLKSFRINPVLLTEDSVRVRSGMLYDFEVPRGSIASTHAAFSSEELESKEVLNLAIMSSPNCSLRLKQPINIPTFFGGSKAISGVALRLDESAAFLAELAADEASDNA